MFAYPEDQRAGAGAVAPGARGTAPLRAGAARHERRSACRSRASARAATRTGCGRVLRTREPGRKLDLLLCRRADRGALSGALRAAGAAAAGAAGRALRGPGGSEARHFELYVGFAAAPAPAGVARRGWRSWRRTRRSWRPAPERCCAFTPGPPAGAVARHSCLHMQALLDLVNAVRAPNQLPAVCCTGILSQATARHDERPSAPADRRRRSRDPRPAGPVPREARLPHHGRGRRQGDAARAWSARTSIWSCST